MEGWPVRGTAKKEEVVAAAAAPSGVGTATPTVVLLAKAKRRTTERSFLNSLPTTTKSQVRSASVPPQENHLLLLDESV